MRPSAAARAPASGGSLDIPAFTEFTARNAGRVLEKPVTARALRSARGDPPATMVALGIQRVFRKPLLFEQLKMAIESVLKP